MGARERPIRLSPELDGLLRKLYSQFRIPRDQYKKRPQDLAVFMRQWNKLSGRNDEALEVIRYMRNQQKAKTDLLKRGLQPWPTFDGTHKRAPDCAPLLDDDQLAILREIYEELVVPMGIGVDLVEANKEVGDELAKRFAMQARKVMPALILIAIAEEKRKRGLWCKVGRSGIGFTDMEGLESASGDDD